MKRILTIQDFSCLGKCSLTVALPILSSMGISCTALPTAVLSTHTGFPAPHIHSLTEDITAIADHWKAIGAEFDAIMVGYLSDPEQAEAVYEVIEKFRCPVVLDPVMGDHGKCYSGIGKEHIEVMKDLCQCAEVILPNVTEASLLTDTPFQEHTDGQYLRQMLDKLNRRGNCNVVITGISPSANSTGFVGYVVDEGMFSYQSKRNPLSQHGTGDMFSAVFTGAWVSGKTVDEAAAIAAGFVERVLEATDTPSPFGAEFEPHLPWLQSQL